MITLRKRNKYFLDNIQKVVEVKSNKFESSDCADQIYKKWDSDWDIFILFVDGRGDPKIRKKWEKRRPLYAVFGKNYVLVTKIISRQIFCMAARCGVREIMDLYLYEMGRFC